jgi:archaemetzincin
MRKSGNKPASQGAINILPLGFTDEAFLSGLSERLGTILGQAVNILQSEAEPSHAFDSRRKQYSSTEILDEIRSKSASRFSKIIGITDVDLYVSGLNFVFGQAHLGGEAAIISLARLRPSFYREGENSKLLFSRAVKEAVHELGHTYGLTHCSDRRCVMSFSNSIRDVDLKGESFCESCGRRYNEILGRETYP